VHNDAGDVVVGRWDGNRTGTFRCFNPPKGPYAYGGSAFLQDRVIPTGGYTGYECLLKAILDFFDTGVCPIAKEETLEMFTFMKASNMSLEKGGREVSMQKAWKAGVKDARKLLKKYRF